MYSGTLDDVIAAAVERAMEKVVGTTPQPAPMEVKLTCSVKEWAQIVGCSLPKAYDMTHIATFPVVCMGKRRIVLLEQAKQWLIAHAGEGLEGM